MSATAEAGLFGAYFAKFSAETLTIPGFTHPVQEYFLHHILESTG
jgi:ATP-dependent RNA helicase DHX57